MPSNRNSYPKRAYRRQAERKHFEKKKRKTQHNCFYSDYCSIFFYEQQNGQWRMGYNRHTQARKSLKRQAARKARKAFLVKGSYYRKVKPNFDSILDW